jgi:hypothetical protein
MPISDLQGSCKAPGARICTFIMTCDLEKLLVAIVHMSRSEIYLAQFEHPEELIPYKLGSLAEFLDLCRSAS